MTRTFDPLRIDDMREIRTHTMDEFERFVSEAGNPAGKFAGYRDRLIAVCLSQGAAQHFVDLAPAETFDTESEVSHERIAEKGFLVYSDGRVISGIKDIDVWFFFEPDDALPAIPNRKHCRKSVDVRLLSLGQRRIDFMKKGVSKEAIPQTDSPTAQEMVRGYLQRTIHGRQYLSKKSVVGLHPDEVFGCVLWKVKRLAAY